MSLLDEYQLNEQNFERCIINGLSMAQLLIIFQLDNVKMDEWCQENYGKNFQTTYEILRQIACEKFSNTINGLSMRGNNTALNIMDRFLNNIQEDKVVKVVFDNKLQPETEENSNG